MACKCTLPFRPAALSSPLHHTHTSCRAAADARRERETAAVTKEARHLQSRRHGGGGSGTSSRQRSYSPEAQQQGEEAEDEYDDKLE